MQCHYTDARATRGQRAALFTAEMTRSCSCAVNGTSRKKRWLEDILHSEGITCLSKEPQIKIKDIITLYNVILKVSNGFLLLSQQAFTNSAKSMLITTADYSLMTGYQSGSVPRMHAHPVVMFVNKKLIMFIMFITRHITL